MSGTKNTDAVHIKEMVIASDEAAMNAHRDLYHFRDDAYIIARDDLLELIMTFSMDLDKLHIATTWIDTLRLVTWKAGPEIGDVFMLLREAGIKTEELLRFRDSDIADIFPYFYYGKRFDVFRRICFIAKRNSERHLRNRDLYVHCYLCSEDDRRIIASSL